MGAYEQGVKDDYHEEQRKLMEKTGCNLVYNIEMLRVLKKMAREDIYPDGTFGDDECCLWEMFRRR